ncbi:MULTISPECIES: hypothetical protein [unclassified Thioalkalivibrio]|uniref:hypothetical protein n=1 Tax=unclassified Thioalkalivibrio TaxID=2621013 RepID=UPI001E523083|nr:MULTISPECIES: hypothetical protein [unclassified Thioalkalivibrio]
MMTLIMVSGLTKIPGDDEIEDTNAVIEQMFDTIFSKPGHSISWGFLQDPARTRSDVEYTMRAARKSAKAMGLDVGDIIDENVDVVSRLCVHEENYIAIWTHPSAIEPEILKMDAKKSAEAKKKIPFIYPDAPDPLKVVSDIYDSHRGVVSSVLASLEDADLVAREMEVHEAANTIRSQIDPSFTSHDWRPTLHGDRIHPRETDCDIPERDHSDMLWPRLDWQLARTPHDPVPHEPTYVRVGDVYYSPMLFELFPQDIHRFGVLFNRIRDAGIPWRITFHMQQGKGHDVTYKNLVTGFLAFLHKENKLIRREIEAMDDRILEGGSPIRMKAVVATWARNLEELKRNQAKLTRAVQSWGNPDLVHDVGSPSEALVSSSVGATFKCPATAAYPPSHDAAMFMPTSRAASSWETGAVMFRTQDDKIWPYQPGSSKQTTWIDLFFAKPGMGKSVLSNAILMGLAMKAGIKQLPYVAVIDIGPSSHGLIKLLRDNLPEGRKHEAVHHKMTMRAEDSVNPLDTQLGLRFPLPHERSFIVNLLTLLGTPVGREKPYENLPEMIGVIIDEAYAQKADPSTATRYHRGIDADVDKAMDEYLPDYDYDDKTTWWELVDALFQRGLPLEAKKAQRHAVPLIGDLGSIASQSPTVSDMYGEKAGVFTSGAGGEPLNQAFSRMMSSVVREFPLFSRPTTTDFSSARVAAIDLNDVAPSGSDNADRQTAVMYMLARRLLASDYYLVYDHLRLFPEEYQKYHEKRIREISESDRRVVYDEFHRTRKALAVRQQVALDMREGRKWNVQVAVLSQNVQDFDADMVRMATNIFILGGANAAEIESIQDIFGLSRTELNLMKNNYIHGPKAGGSSMIFRHQTKTGWNYQLLKFAKGPMELWAFSTTSEDAKLRDEMGRRIGDKEARRALAARFPSGSAKNEIEKRMDSDNQSEAGYQKKSESIIGDLADEVIEWWHTEQHRMQVKESIAAAS